MRSLGIFSLLRVASTFPLTGTTFTAFKTSTHLKMSSTSASNNGTGGGGACEDGVCRPGEKQQPETAPKESMLGTDTTANTATTKTGVLNISIDIISDTMCPWCWVGKRNMELALKDHPEINAEINWLPFFLDRNLPEEGKLVEDYYRDNYGDVNAGNNMKSPLVKAGNKVGIDFDTHYNKITHYRPTIRSHRLIEYAQRQGKQDEMVEELFRMYYHNSGKYLNSIPDLVEAAQNVGLKGGADTDTDTNTDLTGVQAYLESDQGEAEVDELAKKVLPMVQGVPTFLFKRSDKPNMTPLTFSGGQPPHMFELAFENLLEK
jgi:predicted DsbA family dithiol-disulfide isomerase